MENEISKTEQSCTIHSVSSRLFHVHNDIEDAAKWYKIPIALYDRNDDVYIMQEDRCVFVGKPQQAVQFMKRNEGKYCKGNVIGKLAYSTTVIRWHGKFSRKLN